MNGWLCVRLHPNLVYMYVPAPPVVYDAFEPKAFVAEMLLLARVTPTLCPLRGNKVHANRSDELKSELHPDFPPRHTPASNWAPDLVGGPGGPGGSPSVTLLFILLHLCIVHAPLYAKMHTHIDRPR